MSDIRADLDAAIKRITDQPWTADPPPLLSRHCGLAGHWHGNCRSSICECSCHQVAP